MLVPQGASCVSACFLIFLAGDFRVAQGAIKGQRFSAPLGYVGLHRPFINSPDEKTSSQSSPKEIMRKVAAYLDKKMVPRRLVDIMMSRPSNDIYWLSDDDLDEIGENPPTVRAIH